VFGVWGVNDGSPDRNKTASMLSAVNLRCGDRYGWRGCIRVRDHAMFRTMSREMLVRSMCGIDRFAQSDLSKLLRLNSRITE
jgi:hypothetical protein